LLLQYPDEPPRISLIESKGLDEQRQKLLIGIVQEKASQLSSSLMLVELCEVTTLYIFFYSTVLYVEQFSFIAPCYCKSQNVTSFP